MLHIRKHLRAVVIWYAHARWWRALIDSLLITVPMYGGAILSYFVRHEMDQKRWIQAYSALTLLLLLAFFLIRRIFEMIAESTDRVLQQQRDAIGQAHNFTDDLLAQQTADVREGALRFRRTGDGESLFSAAVAGRTYIQEVVDRLYLVLEALYSGPRDRITQIAFEVTFMTKDYDDGFVTIWAWRNRDRRSPRSLLLREARPDIYKDTVTASVYESERPDMVIVEDTRKADFYKPLYEGQKARIQSSIIYPVLADNNELLGTLVTHCDSAGFFKVEDARYWSALLEIYAKRIAHQKVCMDVFRSMGELTGWVGSIGSPELAFQPKAEEQVVTTTDK